MDKLSEILRQADESGDSGQALEGYPEMAEKLERENAQLKQDLEDYKNYLQEEKADNQLVRHGFHLVTGVLYENWHELVGKKDDVLPVSRGRAINRIKDLKDPFTNHQHLSMTGSRSAEYESMFAIEMAVSTSVRTQGAILELMNLFDIKEEDLL